MSTALAKLGIVAEPAAIYHAHPAISKGKLSDFRASHRMYFHQYVACDAPPEKSSKRMDVGTLAHVALLEPERLENAYTIFPASVLAKVKGEPSLNGAESTNAAADFRAEHEAAGKIVLKAHEFDIVQKMAESVRKKIGNWLKLPRRIEHSVYWTDPGTGLECRCRPDWLIETPDTAFCLDFKTTEDISRFKSVVEANDYWLQDAHYSEGLRLSLQCDVEFYFVVVQTAFPWPCALYELEPNDKHQAHVSRLLDMADLAECYRSGDWRDSWDRDEVVKLSLRPFVYQRPCL